MYKIGEFSVLSKSTIKTLRYYEKEGLITPSFVDANGYRYYETDKLLELTKIKSLRQVGFSIDEIKKVKRGDKLRDLLLAKKKELENIQLENNFKISKIKYILGENIMKYEVAMKELPNYVVYYKEGKVKDFTKLTEFILDSGYECMKLNPNIKCIEPDYCFVEYLDGEFKDKDIKVRYSQAVTKEGVSDDNIKFKKLSKVNAVCIYHKVSYQNLGEAYAFIMKYIKENNLIIVDFPRERYIDGVWNKENENDWLTEIQVPVELNRLQQK